MLRSDQTSNNEVDDQEILLRLEKGVELSSLDDTEPFTLTLQEVLLALSSDFLMFEDQALHYFAGYVLSKSNKMHREPCKQCNQVGTTPTGTTESITETLFFGWLKKYDEDWKLSLPSDIFSS